LQEQFITFLNKRKNLQTAVTAPVSDGCFLLFSPCFLIFIKKLFTSGKFYVIILWLREKRPAAKNTVNLAYGFTRSQDTGYRNREYEKFPFPVSRSLTPASRPKPGFHE